MNKFWNEDVADVMEGNGTNADAIGRQNEEAHLDGTCDGGSLTRMFACPICTKVLQDKARAELRAECERRNARLVKA